MNFAILALPRNTDDLRACEVGGTAAPQEIACFGEPLRDIDVTDAGVVEAELQFD
jgi:hypothetical protein